MRFLIYVVLVFISFASQAKEMINPNTCAKKTCTFKVEKTRPAIVRCHSDNGSGGLTMHMIPTNDCVVEATNKSRPEERYWIYAKATTCKKNPGDQFKMNIQWVPCGSAKGGNQCDIEIKNGQTTYKIPKTNESLLARVCDTNQGTYIDKTIAPSDWPH